MLYTLLIPSNLRGLQYIKSLYNSFYNTYWKNLFIDQIIATYLENVCWSYTNRAIISVVVLRY
jgi:hypothetical protein